MHPSLLPAITLSLMIIAITLIHCPTSLCDDEQYLTCLAPFNCSGYNNLTYPFWGSNQPEYCGHPSFKLDCSSNVPWINITYINYRVLHINKSSRTLKVAKMDYWGRVCPSALVNTTIDFTLFSYTSNTNLTLYYQCPVPLGPITPPTSTSVLQFNCTINNTNFFNYYSQNIYSPSGGSTLSSGCSQEHPHLK